MSILALPAASAHADETITNATLEALMQSGLAHRDAGEFPAAETDFRTIVDARPDHADARLLLALVIGYQDRFDEALSVLAPAIRQSPTRDDLILARARLNAWAGNAALAQTDVDAVLARDPENTTARDLAAWLARAETANATPYTVSLSRARSDFDRRAMATWDETRLGLAYRSDADWSVNGALEHHRRYANTDNRLELGGAFSVNERLSLSLSGEASPGALFLPRWGLGGGLEAKAWDGARGHGIGPGFATLHARHREYANVGVKSLDPGWVQYFGDGFAWLTARRTHTWSDDANGVLTGWSVRGDWTLAPHAPFSVYALRATAPETELGTTVDTRTWAGGLVWHATDTLDLRLDHSRDDRNGSYIRNVWSLGAAVKF